MAKITTADEIAGKEASDTTALEPGETEFEQPDEVQQNPAQQNPAQQDGLAARTPSKILTPADEQRTTKAALAAQQKFIITLPQNRPGQDQMGDKFVQINGYGYQIKRGEPVSVPESVYLILVQGGEVTPQREQDKIYRPRMTYVPSRPLSEQTPQNYQ